MSKWLNTEKMIWKKATKPCHALAFCPYGQLVEEFPSRDDGGVTSCEVFGHDCPVFYHAEPVSEGAPADAVVGEMWAFCKEIDARYTASRKSRREH